MRVVRMTSLRVYCIRVHCHCAVRVRSVCKQQHSLTGQLGYSSKETGDIVLVSKLNSSCSHRQKCPSQGLGAPLTVTVFDFEVAITGIRFSTVTDTGVNTQSQPSSSLCFLVSYVKK